MVLLPSDVDPSSASSSVAIPAGSGFKCENLTGRQFVGQVPPGAAEHCPQYRRFEEHVLEPGRVTEFEFDFDNNPLFPPPLGEVGSITVLYRDAQNPPVHTEASLILHVGNGGFSRGAPWLNKVGGRWEGFEGIIATLPEGTKAGWWLAGFSGGGVVWRIYD